MKGPESYDTITYREMHTRCACCHFNGSSLNPLELHHIVSRSCKGSCDHRVYLMLCRSCHSCHHHVSAGDQQLDLGHILWIKRDEDGEGGEAEGAEKGQQEEGEVRNSIRRGKIRKKRI